MQSKQRKACMSILATFPLYIVCGRTCRVKVFWCLVSFDPALDVMIFL